jgi:hypothetical protein
MTRTKILAAAVAVSSIILIAAGAALRDVRHDVPQPSNESDFDQRWVSIKGDRLPLPVPTPVAVAAAQSAVAPPVTAPPETLPPATEDDIRQAEEEHHRHRDICPHGRTYFTIEHHQYWRCKL